MGLITKGNKMAIDTTRYDLKAIVLKTMREETIRIVEEEAKIAADKVEKRIRGMAGQVAMEASKQYSVYEQQDNLIITIKQK